MIFSYNEVQNISNIYGNDFFIFDKDKFCNNYLQLERSFKKHYTKFRIGYSYKTNYTPYICKLIDSLGGLAEVVSEMELELSERLLVSPENVIYNGPSKSISSLKKALYNGSIVNLDSLRDLAVVIDLSRNDPEATFSCVLRCNFPLDSVDVSRFGFDVDGPDFVEALDLIKSNNIRLDGLHCHFPNRDLSSYKLRIDKMLELIDLYFIKPPKFLNIGGGFFSSIPKDMWDQFGGCPPSFDDYAEVIGGALAKKYPGGDGPTLIVEPGTALVADTFSFFCKVISAKSVRGKNIATVQGSIFTISPTARNESLPVSLISDQPVSASNFDIAGFTCIEGDYLSKSVPFNITEGDFLMYENVGSYSIVMKPPFILPAPPVLCFDNGEISIIKNRETNSNVFERFVF